MVSDSTSLTRDHFRQARRKSRLMDSPCRQISQQNSGTGITIARPRRQSRPTSTTPRPASITTESDTSTTPKARNSQSRSVSADTRVMMLPVFLREKNARLRLWRCS